MLILSGLQKARESLSVADGTTCFKHSVMMTRSDQESREGREVMGAFTSCLIRCRLVQRPGSWIRTFTSVSSVKTMPFSK